MVQFATHVFSVDYFATVQHTIQYGVDWFDDWRMMNWKREVEVLHILQAVIIVQRNIHMMNLIIVTNF